MSIARSILLLTFLVSSPPLLANQVVLPGSVQVSSLGRARDPAVAYNTVDRTWLVVWREDEPGNSANGEIWGRVVREDRTFGTAPFNIGGGVALVSPRAAHDPLRNEWIVVYGAGPSFEPSPMRILARKVTSTGVLVGSSVALLSAGDLGEASCDVAASRSFSNIVVGDPVPSFMVVWQQNFGAAPGIVALRLFHDAAAPSQISFTGAPFRVDVDASLPGGRRSTRPRITEFAPTTSGSGVGGATRSESFHRVVFELDADGQKDIYLAAMNLSTVRTTVRLTQTAQNETAPVVAYNPTSLRTLVTHERAGSGIRGQVLGRGDVGGLLEILGPDFPISPGQTPSAALQAGSDIFFASAEDATRLGLGCVAGQRVVGTPSVGTGTGSTQPVLSASAVGGVLLGFTRLNADASRVIRASIVDPLAAIPNTAPVARAGADVQVAEGTLFNLDGTASSDANGDPLRYQWSRTDAGAAGDFFVSAAERSRAAPQLQAPQLGADLQPLTLTFQLAVDDYRLDPTFSSTDAVTVTVVPGADPHPPVARAGQDRSVDEDAPVSLDGSASTDQDGDPLTFSWTLTSVTPPAIPTNAVSLGGANTAQASFTAPRFGQSGGIDLHFRLTVTTPRGGTGEDEVVIHVRDSINEAPDANAGPNQTVDEATSFPLDGTGSSDPNGDALTFRWEVASTLSFNGNVRETVQFSDPTSPTPAVVAQIFNERDLTFRLTVRDPSGAEDTDDVVIHVKPVPMQVLSISPMEGSPGTRVTIRGVNLFDPGTKVFFNGSDITHQGIIESMNDTEIVVLVPSGGPSRLRALDIKSKLKAMVAIDYHDVTTGPVTVKKGTEEITSAQPFVVSHLEIHDAFLNQGIEYYPMVQKKDTLLQLRVRTSAGGPQSPLAELSGASCAVLPTDGSPAWQADQIRVPARALAPTATVTRMDEAVNFHLQGSRMTAPAYRFSAHVFNNGVEVAAFRTDLDSATFHPTHGLRILGVKVVPHENGHVAQSFDTERPGMLARIDAAVSTFRRVYPTPDVEFVFWPDEVELGSIIQGDGKVHLEAFSFSENFLINQVGAFNNLVDLLDSWNNFHPDQPATVVVAFIAESLYAAGTAQGVAVPPNAMMADIVKFVATKDIGAVGDLILDILGLVEEALCTVSFGLFCKDPVDIIVEAVLALIEVGTPYDVTGKISLVITNSEAGSTLCQEVGHNLGFVNPFSPEHDADNISHSKFDEDNNYLTFLSASNVTAPIFNVTFAQAALFNGSRLPKSVMSYAPSSSNANCFFEPLQYLSLFNAFRADGGGGGNPGAGHGAAGPALRISGRYAFRARTFALGEIRPALPSEPLSVEAPRSPFTLVYLDAQGQTLAERGLSFNLTLPIHGHGDDGTDDEEGDVLALFSAVQEIPARTILVELRYQGLKLWSRSTIGTIPQVELSFPRGGEVFEPGAEVLVRWLSLDADGDELTHSLFYSEDGGASFSPVAVALGGGQHLWSTEGARGSEHAVIKVVTTDGFHSAEAISQEFSLGGGAPSASILSPLSGQTLAASAAVLLSGTARSGGGKEVTSDDVYHWSLATTEPPVALGTGRQLLAGPFAAGTHKLRLEVDIDGKTTLSEVIVELLPDTDGDGIDDATETANGLDPANPEDNFRDSDGDGITDGAEILTFNSSPDAADTDGDGVPDGREVEIFTLPTSADTDGDAVADDRDNCPIVANSDQADRDQDGLGDACETDSPPTGASFRRGDSNLDGRVNISDPSFTLSFLFTGGAPLGCVDAGDANDDGRTDISDAVATLNFLFLGGAPLPAPGVESCGVDSTEDALDCLDQTPCN